MKKRKVDVSCFSRDVWYLLFEKLAPFDLLSLRMVDQRLRELVENERTWWKRFRSHLIVTFSQFVHIGWDKLPTWKFFVMLKNSKMVRTNDIKMFMDMNLPFGIKEYKISTLTNNDCAIQYENYRFTLCQGFAYAASDNLIIRSESSINLKNYVKLFMSTCVDDLIDYFSFQSIFAGSSLFEKLCIRPAKQHILMKCVTLKNGIFI